MSTERSTVWQADDFAEFHQPFGEEGGILPGGIKAAQQRSGIFPNPGICAIIPAGKQTHHYAEHISVDSGLRLSEGN